ncbi:chaperone protein dnaJ 8, chloroplastic isoform X1 [Phoenix dactylifera]|uniref:Chaperone protein dnaJ 8, chloroplastic isoform X1 n=1 Tax=Phoenix dactylifera TaxID=42345 RepID=A0A8B7BVV3_PHODC|nr:chaperone protein dnaJ 8, chloroplastic isoform X1 [Phoenix dactylifera]
MKKAATPSRGLGNGSAGGGLFSRSPESRRWVRFPARSLPFSGQFATLGLAPSASKSDVKRAYKHLALKYHPDVMRGEKGVQEEEAFREIKSAYESIMAQFEEESHSTERALNDEWDEWDEWMGFEGGIPVVDHLY